MLNGRHYIVHAALSNAILSRRDAQEIWNDARFQLGLPHLRPRSGAGMACVDAPQSALPRQ
jgi:hypothetical protein